MSRLLVGIDPDVTLSGVAVLDIDTNTVELKNLSFFQLFDYLQNYKEIIQGVSLEAGFLNKGNWRVGFGQKANYAGQIGERVGANHETAKKIKEMLEYLGIKHDLIKPKKTKMNNETIQQKAERYKIKGVPKRTNAEQRDALALLI